MPHPAARSRTGMALCALSMAVFAVQDAFTRVLTQSVAPAQIMTVRMWAFAAVSVAWAAWRGQLAKALRPARPGLQALRAAFSAFEIVTVGFMLKYMGLAEAHALFASFPLMAALMAFAALGERVSLSRAAAIVAGFCGALLIIRPGPGVFRAEALIPLLAAALFAAYQVAGRLAARHDHYLTSVVQVAVTGAVILTPMGLWSWRAASGAEWAMIGAISICGIIGHMLLIRALEHTEASALQPFNYLLLAFATLIGVCWFGERPDALSVAGALIIAAAGLYSISGGRRRAGRASGKG